MRDETKFPLQKDICTSSQKAEQFIHKIEQSEKKPLFKTVFNKEILIVELTSFFYFKMTAQLVLYN